MKRTYDALTVGIYNFLAQHGIAVHYQLLTEAVSDKSYDIYSEEFRVDTNKVLWRLVHHPELFTNMGEGVFWLSGKREGRTYPNLE